MDNWESQLQRNEQNKLSGCGIKQDELKREGQIYIGLAGLVW